MATVHKNILSLQEIDTLCQYLAIDDDRSDHRETMSSKHPRWDVDRWPQDIVEKVVNQLVDFDWAVDELVIFDQRAYNQKVHVDSHREWSSSRLGPALLIPLWFEPRASTVFFDNYWTGTTAKFSRQAAKQAINVAGHGLSTPLQSDYSKIVNINNTEFDQEFYYKYLSYLNIEDLHGLTVESIVDWQLGDVLTWDRTQLHCSSNQHRRKKYLTVFTHRLNTQ